MVLRRKNGRGSATSSSALPRPGAHGVPRYLAQWQSTILPVKQGERRWTATEDGAATVLVVGPQLPLCFLAASLKTEYWLSLFPCGGYVLPALEEEEAFAKIPLRSRIVFALGGPVANILGAFVCLSLVNALKLGFSVNSVIYLPVEQIIEMARQICAVIPSLFSQPEQLSGVVGIIAAGGVHVGLDFVKLLQFSVLLNVNLAIFNLLPLPPLDGGKIVMGVLRREV